MIAPALFRRDGWGQLRLHESSTTVEQCVRKRLNCLPLVQDIVGRGRTVDFSAYDSEQSLVFALVKSIFRGLLRYDAGTFRLAQDAAKRMRPLARRDSSPLFCTPPYTYVHYPNDTSEHSCYHVDVDTYKGAYLIAWIPLNSCEHSPISLRPRSQNRLAMTNALGTIERRLGIRIPWYFERELSPQPQVGECLVWDGRLHHRGNINQSRQVHVVVNSRLSSFPDRFEPTVTYDELVRTTTPPAFDESSDPREFAELYLRVVAGIEKVAASLGRAKQDLREQADSTLEWIRGLDIQPIDQRRISFGLTLGTMRRPSHDPAVAAINLTASLLGPEHLWSLNSFMDFAVEQFSRADTQQFLIDYNKSHPYYQVREVSRRLLERHSVLSGAKIASPNGAPSYGWL
jgi:hypothetical protein